MTQQAVFVVEVNTPYSNAPGKVVEIWWAAVASEDDAIAKVREASGSTADTEIVVLGKLNPAAAVAERLTAGEIRSAL